MRKTALTSLIFDWGGGAVAEMRYDPNSYQALLSPPVASEETDRVVQGVLWGKNALADDTTVSMKQWNVNQAGTSDGTFSRTIAVEWKNSSTLDVWSVADKQWLTQLDDDFSGSDDIPTLTRYEMLDNGVLKVRRVIRLPNVKKNGVTKNGVKFYFENWTPFRASDVFSALALKLNASGTPTRWYTFGMIPNYPTWYVEQTEGYAVVYKDGAHTTSRVVGLVYGKQPAVNRGGAPGIVSYKLNSMEWSTGIGILPGLTVNATTSTANLADSIIDLEIRIVGRPVSGADFKNTLTTASAQISPPALYSSDYSFSDDLATIVSRLRGYLNTGSGTRTNHLESLLQ